MNSKSVRVQWRLLDTDGHGTDGQMEFIFIYLLQHVTHSFRISTQAS